MKLSLRSKLLLLILPLLAVLAFLFITVLLPYQRVKTDISTLRPDVSKTVALGDLGIAFSQQMTEYYKLIVGGGAEDKFQEAQHSAQQSLERLKKEIATPGNSEQDGEAINSVNEFAGQYDELNRLSQTGLELVKSGQRDQALNLIETKIEPLLDDSLRVKFEQLDAKNGIKFDEDLARLRGHSDDLITFSRGDLQSNIKNMKGHITDTFLVLTVARNFNQQMQEYYFLIMAQSSDVEELESARRTTSQALESWKINEGGGVGQRTTANKDLEDVEKVESELSKLNQLGQAIPNFAKRGETTQALHLLTDEMEPIAHGQLADLLSESVQHEGKALGESLDKVNQSSTQMQWSLGAFSLLVLIVGLGTPWLLSRTLISPILELRKAASKVGSGELETKVTVTSKGELAQLATTFNHMTEALKESRDSLNEANRELEQKVSDRTVELKNSNEQLQVELVERGRTTGIIESSLREKEMLLKEVHHRVKNNMQVISSLLNLQGKQIKDEQARAIFQDSQNRVKSMALIHESLYQTDDLSHIDFAEYLRKLINHISRSYQIQTEAIKMKVNVGDLALGVDTAVPCGLIINELISNSLKHAFPAGTAGEILIDLDTNDGGYKLTLSDDGIGLPKDLDIEHAKTLGLKLVRTLTEQLRGQLSHSNGHGTKFEITFPV
jgi:two-component sensor histidine kinase